MKFDKTFAELCTPAKIYFSLSILSILFGLFDGFNVVAVLTHLFFTFVWTFVLSWLCKQGFKNLSWFLVLLPFLFLFLVFFGIMRNIKQINYLNPLKDQVNIAQLRALQA